MMNFTWKQIVDLTVDVALDAQYDSENIRAALKLGFAGKFVNELSLIASMLVSHPDYRATIRIQFIRDVEEAMELLENEE